jgi:hypothetical protein
MFAIFILERVVKKLEKGQIFIIKYLKIFKYKKIIKYFYSLIKNFIKNIINFYIIL